jgi:hypothetical protein
MLLIPRRFIGQARTLSSGLLVLALASCAAPAIAQPAGHASLGSDAVAGRPDDDKSCDCDWEVGTRFRAPDVRFFPETGVVAPRNDLHAYAHTRLPLAHFCLFGC